MAQAPLWTSFWSRPTIERITWFTGFLLGRSASQSDPANPREVPTENFSHCSLPYAIGSHDPNGLPVTGTHGRSYLSATLSEKKKRSVFFFVVYIRRSSMLLLGVVGWLHRGTPSERNKVRTLCVRARRMLKVSAGSKATFFMTKPGALER